MSQVSRSEERGLDALTEYGWELVDEMAEEYDDQLGDDLRDIYDGYHADQEGNDGRD